MDLLHRMTFKGKKGAKELAKKGKELVKPSKSRGLIQAEIETELDILEGDFTDQITRQFQILGEEGLTRTGRAAAESSIELCLGGLNLVKLAREDVRIVSTNAALAASMRSLGHSMKMINRMNAMAPEIKTKFLKKQIERLNDTASDERKASAIRETMNSVSREKMDKQWNDNVQAVITGSMKVKDFVVKCGQIESPYEMVYRGGSREMDDADFYERMRKLDDAGFKPFSGDVESSAESIERSAEDLKAAAAFDADIDSIY